MEDRLQYLEFTYNGFEAVFQKIATRFNTIEETLKKQGEKIDSYEDRMDSFAAELETFRQRFDAFQSKDETEICQTQVIKDKVGKIDEDLQRFRHVFDDVNTCKDRLNVVETRFKKDVDLVSIQALHDELEKKLDSTSKTWADVAKGAIDPKQIVAKAMEEHEKRAAKALNARLRGVNFEGDDNNLLSEVKKYISSTFSVQEDFVIAAWRGRFQPSHVFLRFKDENTRLTVLRRRGCLKGTHYYLDEDLTPLQWEDRKKLILDAKGKGQKVLFRDGRPIYVALDVKSTSPPT